VPAGEGVIFNENAEKTGVLLMDRFMGRFRHGFGRRFRQGPGAEGKPVTLAQLPTGQSGTVVEILGGAMLMRGPVTIQIGNAQVAIGFSMANRVIVEPG